MQVAHAPLLLPPLRRLLDPRPHHGLLALPLVAVVDQVVSPLAGSTIVFPGLTTSSSRPACSPCF